MSAVEAAAAVFAEHGHPGEMLTCLGEAWMLCGCGHQIKVEVSDGTAKVGAANDEYRRHVAEALAAAGLLADPHPT